VGLAHRSALPKQMQRPMVAVDVAEGNVRVAAIGKEEKVKVRGEEDLKQEAAVLSKEKVGV